jgi:hypothetical protein
MNEEKEPSFWSKLGTGFLTGLHDLDHHAALGKIAVVWSYFESLVDLNITILAKLESREVGVCLTSQIAGISRKLDAYIALAKLRGAAPALSKQLEGFAKDTIGLAEQRNRYIHDVWTLSQYPKPASRLEATARRKLRLKQIDTPGSELHSFAHTVAKHAVRFIGLSQEARRLLPASPETLPEKADL